MKTIKIAHLYYDLMNLYGENGNVRFLKKKIEDQNVKTEVHFLTIDDDIDFTKYDLYYIGTGAEDNMQLVLNDLAKYKNDIKKALKDKFFLVTGNALELFSENINLQEESIKGLGIFPYNVKEEEFRIVGEQCFNSDYFNGKIIGFQNRACSIDNIDNNLFKVDIGCGFNPNSKNEGIKQNNFYGTYLLGPILVRNPMICDYIIKELFTEKNIPYKKANKKDSAHKAYEELINNFYS